MIIIFYRWFWLDIYYKVICFFTPQQKWLLDVIPNTWKDKPELILDVLYACVVNYVEEEECFERIVWDGTDGLKDCAAFITECYDWITIKRPILVKEIGKIIHDGFEDFKGEDWLLNFNQEPRKSYDEIYPNLTNLEKKLEERDDYFLTGIVKYRGYLWS